jgi:hypothetical protein
MFDTQEIKLPLAIDYFMEDGEKWVSIKPLRRLYTFEESV